MLQNFISFFTDRRLFPEKSRMLVAVSGGMDSVALCELCLQAGFSFLIGHCNFGLRGAESDRDESFVRKLGEKYGLEVLIKKFDTEGYARQEKIAIQEAARNLRYQWFSELKESGRIDFTLLAHHANDNIETVMMNFFRGTGLEGLTGIKDFTSFGYCYRPLLSFSRSQIEAFCKENNLQWVEDSSNLSNKYTRNYFRNELIPAVRKVYPTAEENILDNIGRFKNINAFYRESIKKIKEEICESKGAELRIPVKKLMKYNNPAFFYELIKEYGFGESQVAELSKLLKSEPGKFIENGQYQIIRHGEWLIISPKLATAEMIAIEKSNDRIRFGDKTLALDLVNMAQFKLNKNEQLAQLDAKNIEFPLILRKWKQGDYFYPLGMRKKKKLSRFFIDLKMPKNQKDQVWLIESGKRIIWIVGLRIDDRFKITAATKEILQLSISSL